MKPLEKIKDAALDTIRHPLGTTQKAVGLAAGTARGAAHGVVGGVHGLLPGRKPATTEPEKSPSPPAEKRAAGRKVHGDPVTPKSPTRKPTASKKAATKKAATKKPAPATRRPASIAPRTAAEVAAGAGPDVTTPVGTTAADVGTNPDTTETDLQQPGTEPLMDPSTVKAAISEAEMMQKGADPDKG